MVDNIKKKQLQVINKIIERIWNIRNERVRKEETNMEKDHEREHKGEENKKAWVKKWKSMNDLKKERCKNIKEQ